MYILLLRVLQKKTLAFLLIPIFLLMACGIYVITSPLGAQAASLDGSNMMIGKVETTMTWSEPVQRNTSKRVGCVSAGDFEWLAL